MRLIGSHMVNIRMFDIETDKTRREFVYLIGRPNINLKDSYRSQNR
jgi:hypothetical protein